MRLELLVWLFPVPPAGGAKLSSQVKDGKVIRACFPAFAQISNLLKQITGLTRYQLHEDLIFQTNLKTACTWRQPVLKIFAMIIFRIHHALVTENGQI